MKTNNTASNTQSKDLTLVAKTFMKRYGHYVNEDRAMPALMDGLKPVHRRILWAMHLLGCHPNAKTVKSARIIGDVIGKYHPHGDSGAYTALVNMANQPSPFVYGEGNWGNILRDPAAKRNGARCMICGAPIWAAGSGVTGTYLCFTCTTGEADDSEDYEIE